MNTRLCWMVVDPFDESVYNKFISGINSDQFTIDKSSGFLLDTLRPEFSLGRFIERTSTTEKATDPFGNETEIIRVEYSQLEFRLSHVAPHLELYNPPRQLNAFVNRLGEFTRGTSAIYCPELPISDWISVIAKVSESFNITAALLNDLVLGEQVTAKIAVQGPSDVREFVTRIVGERSYRFAQITVHASFSAGDLKINLRPDSRAAVRTSKPESLESLRECFRMALTLSNRG